MTTILLAIYILLIFIRPMEWWEPVKDWELVNITAIITVLAALPQFLQDRQRLWRQIPEVRMSVFLLLGVSASWIYPLWLTGIGLAFQEFGKVIVLYLLVVILGRDRRGFRIVLWTVFACVAWMALNGILQIQTGTGFGGSTALWRANASGGVYQIRGFGIFNDPNDLCLVFVMALPLVWAEYRASQGIAIKTLSIACVPLFGYGAYLTQSRGGILGIFGMLAAYAIARTKGVRRWLLAASSILLVTLILPARGQQLGIVDIDRLNAWGAGINAFKRYPIFGVGYGNFTDYSGGIVAHNSYVNALTELGLVGYTPFFLLIFLTIVHLRRTLSLKERLSRQDHYYLTGLYSAIVGYLTAIYFLSRTYNHVLYILLGLAICYTILVCRRIGAFAEVFGPIKTDIRKGLIWCAISIPVIWITIRISNRLAGRG